MKQRLHWKFTWPDMTGGDGGETAGGSGSGEESVAMDVGAAGGGVFTGVGVNKSSIVGNRSEISLSSSDDISSSDADAEDGQGVEEFESKEIERNIRASFVLRISRRIIWGCLSLLCKAPPLVEETYWVTQR